MTAFGFSAFLKLLSLNPKPQRREVRVRLAPSGGGYDFHRSLRLKSGRLIHGGEDLVKLIAEADDLGNPAERRSLIAGLRQLAEWRSDFSGPIVSIPPSVYVSPAEEFRINFLPDFGIRIGDQAVAVHLWNTGSVSLSPRMTYVALQLAISAYDGEVIPDDVAVLSLPDRKILRLSDVPDQSRLANIVADNLDRLFVSVREDLARGAFPPEDRPGQEI